MIIFTRTKIQLTVTISRFPHDDEQYDFGNEPLASSVEISKSNDKNNARVGDTVNYTLVVTNTGKQTIYNLDVIDALPWEDLTMC